ncbi:MAG: septum formation initiator family protein [Anaerolineae bacterium]|nr:septum formation initiator family protein [Anaerolineae bacterium]
MSSNILISLRPENVIRQLPWRVDSKAALGLLLLLAMFSLVGWLYLTQASAVTATSYRIDALRLELDQIKNQNAALTLEIAQLEALDRVEARARELGFGPTTDVRYIPVADYPLPPEPQKVVMGGQPGRNSFDSTGPEFNQTTWWTHILDNLAGWLEGRE